MADKKLTVIIDGKEYVSKSSTKAGKSLTNLEQNAKKVTQTLAKIGIAAAAVATVVHSINKLTEAYGTQIEAEQKRTSALKATNNALGISKKELDDYATAMSRLTGIADEAIIEAQGLMVTFTKVGAEVFPDAIKSAADMSAMFGQDLQQSVIQLGTALNDPVVGIGRLKRIGISFSSDQKKMIEGFMEQNDIMNAQKVILDELNAEFGGVAANMGNEWPKKAQRFHNAITDGKEIWGEYIAEGISPALTKLTEWIEKTNDARKAQKGFNDIWSKGGADDLTDYEQALIEADNRIKDVQQSLFELRSEQEKNNNLFQNAKISREIENQEKNLRLAMADWESINRILAAVKEANDAISAKNKAAIDEAARILELEEMIDSVLLDLGDKKQQEIDATQQQIDKLASYRQEIRESGGDTIEVQEALNLLVEKRNKLLKEQADALLNEKLSGEEIIRKHRLIDQLIESATGKYDQQAQALAQIPEIEALIFQAAEDGNTAWLSQLAEVKAELYEIAGIELPNADVSSDTTSETNINVGGEVGTLIQAFIDGGDILMSLFNIVLSSLGSFEQFNKILNIVSTLLGSIAQTVIVPLLQIVSPFLALVQSIVQVVGTALYPWLQLIIGVMSILTPILEVVASAFTGIAAVVAGVGAVFGWLGNWLNYFGRVVSTAIYNINNPLSQRAMPGAPTQSLGDAVSSAVAAVIRAGTQPFNDLDFSTPAYDDLSYGSSGTSIYGGNTSVNKVPDIYIYQTFNGPVVGAGGMEEFGELTVEAIQDYVGAGGKVTFIEAS